ncbi:MAG TPA: sugar:proton symporter [Actinocrinis sp.]|uniref:sugar:proton symporter n=1 Tax=Actinocrinis sp. TaxID=1920516 RepID=UPI002DDCA9A4|nr:sugar:proton symporter [Actinocrinis sp.]HEV2346986.1 sugar:proton symporter [Actinocrinis sp.]
MPTTHTSGEFGRLVFTLIGSAALIVSAFLNWSRDITGVNLSNHALIRTEFFTQSDIVKTVGGISVLIGLVGMLGLVDRSSWLTRLAGVLGVALFVMFAVEVYRSSYHTMQPGAWLALAGGIVLLLGGFVGGRETTVDDTTVIEERRMGMDPMERVEPTERTERMEPRGMGSDTDSESRGGQT